MAKEEKLDWSGLPTDVLVEELEVTGLDLPDGLIEEILRRGKEAVPALGALVGDEELWDADHEGAWGPIFALHLLGAIGDPAAAPYIVEALRVNPEPDEIVENTPTVIGHLGPEAIPPIAAFLHDEKADGLMRGVASDGLASIALLHPAKREQVLSILRRFVEDAGKHDPVAVTGAIMSLVELRDREALPAIANAFRAGRVDEDFLHIEDARDAMDEPERLSKDWHYTGNPADYFSEKNMAELRQRWGSAED